jgi:adenylate cyclase
MNNHRDTLGETRLFLEETCCELCRFHHVTREELKPEQVVTTREVRLGPPGAYADIKVVPGDRPPYFVEVKWGYPREVLVERLALKYGTNPDGSCGRLVIVTDLSAGEQWAEVKATLRARICDTLEVEIWDEAEIVRRIGECFGLKVEGLANGNHQAIRDAIIGAEWRHAFGDTADDRLAPTLLWHFSSWTLRRLNREHDLPADRILSSGVGRNLAIVMADLCSFSSYVRDSRNDALVRRALTAFYSQARQAVLETGGMLDKFVGDEVIGVFGFPAPQSGYAEDAARCAARLVDIGNSVCEHWQRHLDYQQKSAGVHVGIAIGDLNFMPLRAFSRSHYGFIGDAINMTARLMSAAGPSETVVSNNFYQALRPETQRKFRVREPVEAKNMGPIKCWQREPTSASD